MWCVVGVVGCWWIGALVCFFVCACVDFRWLLLLLLGAYSCCGGGGSGGCCRLVVIGK